ncbi:MarR family transcriptional regulator [Haloferax gibbonsii]|uniref:MarR family transcriptional regulator n=1 Tax=Haloferax gibbonsii TaxID=35746 RepID=UPI0009E621B7|nr:helix-turn-helix domain-containing protein [Haloferax gibbonsii]
MTLVTTMPEPMRVEDLKDREESQFEFPVEPGTNEETALRFLAANPDFGWPPSKIAEKTGINPNSITKTVKRLQEKGLVECISSRYFVDPDQFDEITGMLGDLQGLDQIDSLPDANIQQSDSVDVGETYASESEIDDIIG